MTPMMCSRLLRREHSEAHGRIYRLNERIFRSIVGLYDRALKWVSGTEAFTLGILLITIGVNIYLFLIVPKGFFPLGDTGSSGAAFAHRRTLLFRPCRRLPPGSPISSRRTPR